MLRNLQGLLPGQWQLLNKHLRIGPSTFPLFLPGQQFKPNIGYQWQIYDKDIF